MKTAMQEAIDKIENMKNKSSLPGYPQAYTICQSVLHQLLHKEKEMIVDAYRTGKNHEQSGTLVEINMDGEDYFNKTYNQ